MPYLSPLTVLLIKTSIDYAKINASKINQNAIIVRIRERKNVKFSKIDKKGNKLLRKIIF